MSIQSEITRISNNVQNTIDVIEQTGVSVPAGANSDALPSLAQSLANEKQDKLTGTQGQIVGFDASGNAQAQSAPTPESIGAISNSSIGEPNGIAELDANGLVPASQLPGFVDDVIDAYIIGTTPYAQDWLSLSSGGSPLTPTNSAIYIIVSPGDYQNQQFRWSGTQYAEISSSLALGETMDTAYRGDRGKIAYDHSQTMGNPHGTTAAEVDYNNAETGMVATNVQDAVDELFTSVSNGKSLIAGAITDKGVSTSADATFQQMAENIAAIQAGGKTKIVKFTISGEQSFVTVYYSTKDAVKELYMTPGTSHEISVVESSIFIAVGFFNIPYMPTGIVKIDNSAFKAYFVSQDYNSEVIEIY